MKHILVFYISSFILSFTLIKNKKISFISSMVAYVLSVVELLSYKLTGHHVDFFVITRMDLTMLDMAIQVVPKYVYGIMLISILVILVHWYLYKNFKEDFLKNKKIIVALIIISFFGFYKSTTTKVYIELVKQVGKIYQYSMMNEEIVLKRLNANGRYSKADDITANAGGNIVVIYCESLEGNFLKNDSFAKEIINLKALTERGWYAYDNYQCINGSGWTVGALYATQTGLPTFFGTGGNEIFNSIYNSQTTSFTTVMGTAGYTNLFLSNCKLKFAGTGNMMNKLGYKTFGAENFEQQILKTPWGVHDRELFDLAKLEYKRLLEEGKPFNLTLLTVDTHFPRGLADKTMERYLGNIEDYGSHRFTVASLDYLLGDFVQFIESQQNGKETTIVILSDHLMMGDVKTTPIVADLNKRPRRNLLITNKKIEGFEIGDLIGYYDIPNIILNLAEVKHNAKFGKNLFPDISREFISDNGELFTILNLKLNQ